MSQDCSIGLLVAMQLKLRNKAVSTWEYLEDKVQSDAAEQVFTSEHAGVKDFADQLCFARLTAVCSPTPAGRL